MTAYRPTSLAMVERHCPKALEMFESGVPYDRAVFETGIAAHAILQAVGEATNAAGRQLDQAEVDKLALETVARLIAVGRTFDGDSEPPLNPNRAMEGRDVAVDFLAQWWPTVGASIELGLAVDRNWQPVSYFSADAWLRCILDYAVVEDVKDEESAIRTLFVRDFKSSWAADESELGTIQRKVQALLAWQHFAPENPARMVLQVSNLRTGRTHELEVWPAPTEEATVDPDTLERIEPEPSLLDRWRLDVQATLGALDAQKALGARPASPGAGCLGCPYLLACPWAQDFMEDTKLPGTAERRAQAYAVAYATTQRLSEAVRVDVAGGSIPVPGGVVGYVAKESRTPKAEAYAEAWDRWAESGADGRGFAKAAKLSVSNLEALAMKLFPERTQKQERAEWIASLVEPETKKVFSVYAGRGEE